MNDIDKATVKVMRNFADKIESGEIKLENTKRLKFDRVDNLLNGVQITLKFAQSVKLD